MTTQAVDPSRKTRRGKVTRERIIEVTEGLVARVGPDRFQLQQVTETLGITPPAIYNHFKDRDDLISEVAAKGGRLLTERMKRLEGEDLLATLRRNAREYVAFLGENPAHARLILWETSRRGTPEWRELAPTNLEIRERTRQGFEEAITRGEIRPISLQTYMQVIYVGYAAAIVWQAFPFDAKDAPEDEAAGPLDAETITRLQEQVDDLVLRLIAP